MSKNPLSDCLVVLDFNGTLLARVGEGQRARVLKEKNPDDRLGNGDLLYMRPHAQKLADFLHANGIPYMFWTTAMEHNAVKMHALIKGHGFTKPLHLYTQAYSARLPGHAYKRYKDIAVVSKHTGIPLDRIRLVDDDAYKCSPADCHIPIKTYDPLEDEDAEILRIIQVIGEFARPVAQQ